MQEWHVRTLEHIYMYMVYQKSGQFVFDNYSAIPRSIALADMANERQHQS